MQTTTKQVIELLDYADERDLEIITSRIVLLIGMTPVRQLHVPEPIEDISWVPCWRRGFERVLQMGQQALQ